MDDRTILVAVGEALYGVNWKNQLAAAIHVDDRSLRRWLQTGEVPPGVWRDLRALINVRAAAISRLQCALAVRG